MVTMILNPRSKVAEPLDYFVRNTFPMLVDEEIEMLSEEESAALYLYGCGCKEGE